MRVITPWALCRQNADLEILAVLREHWTPKKEFSLHKHKERPTSALFFVCSKVEVAFETPSGERMITAQEGDAVFIPKGSLYEARVVSNSPDPIDTYTVNLHIYGEGREELLLSEGISLLSHDASGVYATHLKALSDAFYGVTGGGGSNMVRSKGELFLLLDRIGNAASPKEEFYYPIRRGADAMREEWWLNEKIEKYAQMSGVSVTYFYRCFRNWSGKSPVEYRTALRLSHAEGLLRGTDIGIREISQSVGFEDPFYFCRVFEKAYGTSPRRYRTQCRNG